MLTSERGTLPTPAVGTVEIFIAGACGLERAVCFLPKCYAVVSIGDQVYKTKVSGSGRKAVWNETFTFKLTTQDIQDCDVAIKLHCKGFFGRKRLLGQVKDRVFNLWPRNEELTKVISDACKNNPIKISFRVGETLRIPKRRLFALIIGIEKYRSPQIDNLEGCVNDAKSIKSFLSERLLVPDSQIDLLTNEMATRDAIISHFKSHLIKNPDIEQGDAILFFYAGHGSRVEAPAGWISSDNKIETICPHDEWMENPQGDVICGIPDRTISSLLRKLASVKGDNITVIFDSCHSGGIARNLSQGPPLRPRFLSNPCPIPETTDISIWMPDMNRSAKAIIPDGYRYEAMSSHVLLAACRQEQVAYESTSPDGIPHGAFTSCLIKQLSQIALHRVTYSELLDLLPDLIYQNPQCEGKNKNRILFDGQNASRPLNAFRLVEKLPGKFEVETGHVHGVVRGTEFAVQNPNTESLAGKALGILVADEVNADSCILVPRSGDVAFVVPQGASAVVLDWNSDASTLKVFAHPGSEQQVENAVSLRLDPVAQTQKRNFVLVDSRSLADVDIKLESNEDLRIERLDALLSIHASRVVSVTGKHVLDRLPFILDGAAHFKYHLGRHNASDPLGNVTMELYRLTTNPAGFRAPDTTVGNLLTDSEARLELDENAEYGFAIFNYSKHDLFPYLFYFDPSDYSIQSWYVPPARAMDPPLRHLHEPGPGKVTVGYGAGGGDPFVFTLKQGERSDTGFLKLFASTNYVDMDWIAQDTPFDKFSARGGRTKTQDAGAWGAWTAAVTVFTNGSGLLVSDN